jgi:alpha-galactosidase
MIYDLRHKGIDAWDRIRARLSKVREQNPFCWSFFETYGAYPAVHDRHVVEFFPERFPNGRYYGKTLGVDVFSFEETIEAGDRIYREMQEQASGKRPIGQELFSRGPGEHEQLLEILGDIYLDRRNVYSVNMPNQGAVPSLPDQAVLELPGIATARGFRQIYLGEFPEKLAALLTKHLARIEVTVDAALEGDRDLFVEALLLDGSVQDREIAEKMADELISAQKQHLPQFA